MLIREGKAHHFAWTLYPAHLHPSARALESAEVALAWSRIRGALDAPARDFTRTYMFGGAYYGDVVPGWAGYTIGYCLVRGYAERNPERTISDLVRTPPREFLVETPRCPE